MQRLLALLPLCACSYLVIERGPTQCENTSPFCDENELVFCEQGIEIRKDCGANGCDPERSACNGICGDNITDPAEQCDDGPNNSDTLPNACRESCQSAGCGDDVIDNGEECDPPNATDCSATCLFIVASCGDGLVQGQEQCDDGNLFNNDGCLNNCELLLCGDGFVETDAEECDDQNGINTDFCKSDCTLNICGDAAVFNGIEQCDDGNQNNGDNCSNLCQLPRCGDGISQGNEQCDDGNTSNSDGCLNVCVDAACGDGFINSGVEDCDDANQNENDSCLAGCVAASCGDGIVQLGVEDCDDGNTSNTDACTNFCRNATCGDGFVRSGAEECDDQNTSNNDGCLNTCLSASCGDGFTESGVEDCDDANANNKDSCLNTCQNPSCGDGFAEVGTEPCDGSDLGGQSCTGLGFGNGGTLSCNASCQFNTSACIADAGCGDGVRQGSEGCDDGNQNNNDSCLNTCENAGCGDGFTFNQGGTEQCDDQNTSNTDGCLNSCAIATCGDGFIRSGVEDCDDQDQDNTDNCLNTCQNPSCGDGFTHTGVEDCDDQNTSNNDSCLNTCESASCGDGFAFNQNNGTEQCDDGNQNNNDGCQNNCTVPPVDICGDGQISGAEECDDNDTASNDGCSKDCELEADIFVLCDGTTTSGDGSLGNPFRTIIEAATSALAGDVVMILPQSPQACGGGATIAKNLTLQGLADPAEPGTRPTINSGALEAFGINGVGIKVTVRDLLIRGNRTGSLVTILNSSKVAMLRVDALNSSATGAVINCNTLPGGLLLFDQSSIHNNPGNGILVDGSCFAVISNSFFQSNGGLTAQTRVAQIGAATARVDMILSTFDDNHALTSNSVLDGCGNNPSKGRVDSSIFNNNHTMADGITVDPLAGNCTVTFSDVFGIDVNGTGNLNTNPLFTTINTVPFHLGVGSPCRNTANPAPLALLFDPLAIFGVNVFGHDFAGNSRGAGIRDMGMFEEP